MAEIEIPDFRGGNQQIVIRKHRIRIAAGMPGYRVSRVNSALHSLLREIACRGAAAPAVAVHCNGHAARLVELDVLDIAVKRADAEAGALPDVHVCLGNPALFRILQTAADDLLKLFLFVLKTFSDFHDSPSGAIM